MKKLIVLENINGLFGKLPDGQLYPYTEEQGTVDTWYDIYLVDTELPIDKNSLVVMNNELIRSSNVMIDDLVDYDVVIASTDFRTKLPKINQVVIDAFLESDCKNNVVETMEFGDGNHTVMLVSEFENEWIGVDTTLELDTFTDEGLSKFEDFDPILDVSNTVEHLESIEVNGQTLFKGEFQHGWGTSENDNPNYGELWFQPGVPSFSYPDIRGRLLEFCKAESLVPNPGFDDWAEVQIHSINGLYK